MLNKWLFKRIDNSPLIFFRVVFGTLLVAEAWGSIISGFVKEHLIAPQFTFNFIGFDFIQPLPGNWMYVYYILMGIFGVGVAIGYKYKYSIGFYTVMWTCVYLMQKSFYNNHSYLLILLCIFMWMAPAARNFSVDAKQKPSLRRISMPHWISLFIIVQMLIVYTFAAIAKIYPDWMNETFPAILMHSRKHYPIIGPILQQPWVIFGVTYFGFLFDLLIAPLILWKKTRVPAFCLAVFFHIFNSGVFLIGIFPYLALALFVFFFPPKTIHRYLVYKKPFYSGDEIKTPNYRNALLSFFALWFIVQLALPLRHWFIKDDVLWTEEGHRLSWRMMLRQRSGISTYKVVNKTSGKATFIDKSDYLDDGQMGSVATKPDMIWQFCQRLKKDYAEKGKDIKIFVNCKVSINNKPRQQLIDPKVDMAQAKWNYFFHNEWLLPEKKEKTKDD